MQPSAGLFRKSALEKLSSPEQLDVTMQVTSPMGWIALGGVSVLLVFAIVWSVVGSISIRVDGQGILIRGANVFEVTAGAQGRLTEVLVKPGDTVQVGQAVARMAQPDLVLKIENTKAQLVQVESQKRESGSSGSTVAAGYQAQLRELREKVRVQQGLVARGLLTNSTLMRTKEQLLSTEQALAQTRMSQSGQELRVDDLKRMLREMEEQLAASTDVKSPYAGRVLEVVGGIGALVPMGNRILTLEPTDAPLEAVLFIPAGEGKKVRPGMDLRISPSTVKAEEYGFLIGKVKSVGEFPVTPEGLRKILRNDKLAEELAGRFASIEIVASLIPASDTPSGYRWSSSKGPPTPVYSGTQSRGSVVVEKKKPISYVLPVLKKTVGMS
ncbi:MAG: NHLP bacteriocin system secretion protein [Acidobacteriota bacterium]